VAQDATQFLTAVEAGDLFRVDAETIKRHYRQGRITGYKIGRALRFDPAELRAAFRSAPGAGSPARAAEPNFTALD
jgi:hypothetical protein